MRNGRCRMHGGKAGRKPVHGYYTYDAIAERRKAREAMQTLQATIRELAVRADA